MTVIRYGDLNEIEMIMAIEETFNLKITDQDIQKWIKSMTHLWTSYDGSKSIREVTTCSRKRADEDKPDAPASASRSKHTRWRVGLVVFRLRSPYEYESPLHSVRGNQRV